MLNKFLYDSLRAAFGSVLVENEGMHAELVRDYTTGYTTTWRMQDGGGHGEQYRINCPFCRDRSGQPDRGHHLYVSYLSYARPVVGGVELATGPLFAHCFRCGSMQDRGRRGELESMIHAGMSSCGDGMSVSASVDMSGTCQRDELYSVSDAVTLDGIRTWVPDFRWCADDGCDKDVLEYLEGRGVTRGDMLQFGLGWGEVRTPRTGRLLNGGAPWVVVPVVLNGMLKGVQARCPDKFIGDDGLRYWIHPGMRKRSVVYNMDAARETGVAVVCEGVFDVFKVGAPGVCCFGHTPSPVQRSMLETAGAGVVLLPDNESRPDFDAVEEAQALAAELSAGGRLSLGAHVVRLPAKDAGEMSREAVWGCILQQVPQDMRGYLEGHVIGRL